jgi:hypothetical protein
VATYRANGLEVRLARTPDPLLSAAHRYWVRTRGLDIKAGAAKLKADKAGRLEAELVIDRWNRRLATGRDMLWSPTIRAALIAGTPWLDVFCPGCGNQPGDRSADGRPPPAGLCGHACARPAVLLVSGLRADAEAAWAVHAAASGYCSEKLRMRITVP